MFALLIYLLHRDSAGQAYHQTNPDPRILSSAVFLGESRAELTVNAQHVFFRGTAVGGREIWVCLMTESVDIYVIIIRPNQKVVAYNLF